MKILYSNFRWKFFNPERILPNDLKKRTLEMLEEESYENSKKIRDRNSSDDSSSDEEILMKIFITRISKHPPPFQQKVGEKMQNWKSKKSKGKKFMLIEKGDEAGKDKDRHSLIDIIQKLDI